jgi:hypothetical protein
LVWYKLVPLKVTLLRLLSNNNLARRELLHLESSLCFGGCAVDETFNHLLFDCDSFVLLWRVILKWLGISSVFPITSQSHASQFCNFYLFRKEIRHCLQAVWLVCCWII